MKLWYVETYYKDGTRFQHWFARKKQATEFSAAVDKEYGENIRRATPPTEVAIGPKGQPHVTAEDLGYWLNKHNVVNPV